MHMVPHCGTTAAARRKLGWSRQGPHVWYVTAGHLRLCTDRPRPCRQRGLEPCNNQSSLMSQQDSQTSGRCNAQQCARGAQNLGKSCGHIYCCSTVACTGQSCTMQCYRSPNPATGTNLFKPHTAEGAPVLGWQLLQNGRQQQGIPEHLRSSHSSAACELRAVLLCGVMMRMLIMTAIAR